MILRALILALLSLSAQAQWVPLSMPTNFITTNLIATNLPPLESRLLLEWWMQCHPELLTDTVQVAVESRKNFIGPWLLRTQWMQGLDQNPKRLTWAFTASNQMEFYRVRSTRIYP